MEHARPDNPAWRDSQSQNSCIIKPMRNAKVWLWMLAVLVALVLPGEVRAQEGDRFFFPETGHWVSGPFWAWYQQHPQSAQVLQQPITEAFTDPESGLPVQYFVGGRLELRADRVTMTPLGLYFHETAPGLPLNYPLPAAACHAFEETGHRVCYAFWEYYRQLGGLEALGYPVSEIEYQEGMLVQYFQFARLEWHPENPPGHQIVVTDLGMRYFRMLGLDTALLRPNPAANVLHPVTRLVVRPSVRYAVLPATTPQTLYVVVQDQIQQPIAGAQVSFRLITPQGTEIAYQLLPTDEHGIVRYTFHLQGISPGLVQVIVQAEYEGLRATGRTAFRIWW